MNFMDELHTLTGMTLGEAALKLREILPPSAYKAVPGASGLTDIDPSYLTLRATESFGFAGLGWHFTYNPEDMVLRFEERTGKTRQYVVCIASLRSLHMRYRFVLPNGEWHWSEDILSSGYSENENEGYAIRGALTNAIGAAFAKLLWQLGVYQGKITHSNAADIYERYKAKVAASQEEKVTEIDNLPVVQPDASADPIPEVTIVQETTPEVTHSNLPEPSSTATSAAYAVVTEDKPKKAAAKKEKAASQTPEAVAAGSMTVEEAQKVVIPSGVGVPLAGKTLGEAMNDAVLGAPILKFLSGNAKNAAGNTFTPSTPSDTRLQKAAQVLLPTL